MSDRKTLQLRDPSAQDAGSALKKKGRGWAIEEKRLDTLHERAREMGRNPSPAQSALAAALAATDTGSFSFRRHAVIGSAIVDFACNPLMMVVQIDGEADDGLTATRDRSLAQVGHRIVRLSAPEILGDPASAAAHVVEAMRERWHERRDRARVNAAAPNPRNDRARNR